MKPSVGVPYVYISRDRQSLAGFLAGDRTKPSEVLKLSTGDKSFLSFTSEFRFEGAGEKSILATLELLDTDRDFELFFLEDAVKIGTNYGIVYYFAFGIGNSGSPIHAMTFIGLVNRDDNSGLRKIIMEFVTGAGGEAFDIYKNGLDKDPSTDSSDLHVEAMTSVLAFGNVTEGRILRDFDYIYTQSLTKLAARFTEKPVLVILPALKPLLDRISNKLDKEAWASFSNGKTDERKLHLVKSYYNSLGFNTLDLKEENIKKLQILADEDAAKFSAFQTGGLLYSIDPGFLKKLIKESPITVYFNDEISNSKVSLKSALTIILAKLTSKTDYIFEPELTWNTDPNAINILRESGLFPQITEDTSEILIIGDNNTINSYIYGAATNIVANKASDNLGATENDTHAINIEFPYYLLPPKVYELGQEINENIPVYKKLWDYYSSVLRPSKEDSDLFRSFFSSEGTIRTFIQNSGITDDEEAIDSILDTIPMFTYNVKDSNILNISIEKSDVFFVSLMKVYGDLAKAKTDLTKLLPSFLIDKTPQKSTSTDTPSGDSIKRKAIELYTLASYNDQIYTVRVKTLPLFTFSTPSIVGVGLVGILGNGLKVTGKYNLEPTALDRIYTGLWNILGYKHTISNGDVSSEFMLIRRNHNLYNSGFLAKQLKLQEQQAKQEIFISGAEEEIPF